MARFTERVADTAKDQVAESLQALHRELAEVSVTLTGKAWTTPDCPCRQAGREPSVAYYQKKGCRNAGCSKVKGDYYKAWRNKQGAEE